MNRFYISSQDILADKITVNDKKLAHHIKDVLRLKAKEEVLAFDNQGNGYLCFIRELLSNRISLEIKNKLPPKQKTSVVTIGCALPKKTNMDDIVDKLTQLGVDRIIPLNTERVIIKLDAARQAKRLLRWRKIALSASEQSQRDTLPVIEEIKDLSQVFSGPDNFDLKLIPTLRGERKSLKEIFSNYNFANILALIGPEGDFTKEEAAFAGKNGCIPVTLGDLVLRVETAAVAVASFIKLYEGH